MSEEKMATAKQKYDEFMAGNQELSAIERLRFFCSCAMSGQDWLDVESFFDDLAAHPSAQAIETAAIMRASEQVEDFFKFRSDLHPAYVKQLQGEILALIPQDGWTQLEEFGMKVANEIAEHYGYSLLTEKALNAIVTNLIGAAK